MLVAKLKYKVQERRAVLCDPGADLIVGRRKLEFCKSGREAGSGGVELRSG